MRSPSLRFDYEATETFAGIIGGLQLAREEAGLTQIWLAEGLSVRGRAICDWERGAANPTLEHLIGWAGELGLRLALIGPTGKLLPTVLRQLPTESWETFQQRQLATHLRDRRTALGWSQTKSGKKIGVSRDMLNKWELLRKPPRSISLVVWAQAHGFTLVLAPIDVQDRRRRRPSSLRARHSRQESPSPLSALAAPRRENHSRPLKATAPRCHTPPNEQRSTRDSELDDDRSNIRVHI